jgi:hypothetical protein
MYFNAPVVAVGGTNAPPFQVQTKGLGAGHYIGFASATDNEGVVSYAVPVEFMVEQPAGTPPLRIRQDNLGGQPVVILEWDDEMAVLVHSTSLSGGVWTPVPGAGSPFAVNPSQTAEFFRLRY